MPRDPTIFNQTNNTPQQPAVAIDDNGIETLFLDAVCTIEALYYFHTLNLSKQ